MRLTVTIVLAAFLFIGIAAARQGEHISEEHQQRIEKDLKKAVVNEVQDEDVKEKLPEPLAQIENYWATCARMKCKCGVFGRC